MNINLDFFDNVEFFDKLNSTSDKAIECIENQIEKGNFLIIAEEQVSGFGRNKKNWYSPRGGIWMSIGLSDFPVQTNLTLFTGKIVHKTLSSMFPSIKSELKIKWPNDIYLRNKKICGIMTNYLTKFKYHIIGIGLNTNIEGFPTEIKENASSLLTELSQKVDNEMIINEFSAAFMTDLMQLFDSDLKETIDYLRENSYLLNRNIIIDTDFDKFKGRVVGFKNDGAIILELESGLIQPFYSGSVLVEE